ncbi:MAG: hypothetical protein BWY77_00339 [bacterium ADurb.Bin431]|nr:MAG: hypothetical protein BWY77_00339 [bacterium ADurb.Bin431]
MAPARLRRNGIGQGRPGEGRIKIEFKDLLARGARAQNHSHSIRSGRAGKADEGVPMRPDQEVTAPGAESAESFRIAGAPRQWIELGIVIETEGDVCAGKRTVGSIERSHHQGPGHGITLEQIDLTVAGRSCEHLLTTCPGSLHPGVDEHGPPRRFGEPAHIEVRFGFAGPEIVPLSVGPEFHPGMVVVAVRPARRVDLTGGDTHCTQGGDGEDRLLPAAADRAAHGRQGGAGAHVRTAVGDMLVTPVIDLEGGLAHGHAAHPLPEQARQHHPGGVEVLIVDAQGKDKVQKKVGRKGAAPGHLLANLQGGVHLAQVKFPVIVGEVAEGHPGVEPLKG